MPKPVGSSIFLPLVEGIKSSAIAKWNDLLIYHST